MALWAGKGAGLVSRMQSAGEIVKELVEQAEKVLLDAVSLFQRD